MMAHLLLLPPLLVGLLLLLAPPAPAHAWASGSVRRKSSSPPTPPSPPPPPPPPSFCIEEEAPASAPCRPAQQTTMSGSGQLLRVYHSLFYHNHQFFAVVGGSRGAGQQQQCSSSSSEGGGCAAAALHDDPRDDPIDLRPSINRGIETLPAADAGAFVANLKACCVPGVTLLLDFPFAAFPDNLGYWSELLLPLYSVLRRPGWRAAAGGAVAGVDRVLLTNVQKHMYDWPKKVLTLALAAAAAAGTTTPTPALVEEGELAAYCQAGWASFEHLLVVKDRYWDYAAAEQRRRRPPPPPRAPAAEDRDPHHDRWPLAVGFRTPRDAAAFRAAAHALERWPLLPDGGGGKVATVALYPEGYPQVVNHAALVRMLEDLLQPHGYKVRTVSLTMEAPFVSHLATAAGTRLLVARHGPLLADAALLPDGATVLELLPFKWEWRDIGSLYANLTRSAGRLHYLSWRPDDARWCRYAEPGDERYANWTPAECSSKACLLAHARAGLEVDLAAVRRLLEDNVHLLLA